MSKSQIMRQAWSLYRATVAAGRRSAAASCSRKRRSGSESTEIAISAAEYIAKRG